MPSPPKIERKTARSRVNNTNLKRLGLNNTNGEPGLGNTALLVNATTGYNFNKTRAQLKPKAQANKFNPFNRNAMAKAAAAAAPYWNRFTRKNNNKNKKNGNGNK